MPQHHPVLGSLQQSRPWRRHSTLKWLRSICAMPASWNLEIPATLTAADEVIE
jgi:hypothetical protein